MMVYLFVKQINLFYNIIFDQQFNEFETNKPRLVSLRLMDQLKHMKQLIKLKIQIILCLLIPSKPPKTTKY